MIAFVRVIDIPCRNKSPPVTFEIPKSSTLMPERASRTKRATESLLPRHLWQQKLDGDLGVEPDVMRGDDDAHSPDAEHLFHAVLTRYDVTLVHGGPRPPSLSQRDWSQPRPPANRYHRNGPSVITKPMPGERANRPELTPRRSPRIKASSPSAAAPAAARYAGPRGFSLENEFFVFTPRPA